MIFQLFEAEAFMSAIMLLLYLGVVALVLIVLGIGFLALRRITSRELRIRRGILRGLGIFFVTSGALIPVSCVIFIAVASWWIYPKIEKTWDFSASRSIAHFASSECSVREDFSDLEHQCIYQGELSLAIRLPEGRNLNEKAELVWVDAEQNQITKIMIFSRRYDTNEMHAKVEELIADWNLDPSKYRQWRDSVREDEKKPLYYWWDDASPGNPRLWLKVKRLDDEERRPWFLQMDLHWE
jgi:hypothetical protein